jgi:hypothetical protein
VFVCEACVQAVLKGEARPPQISCLEGLESYLGCSARVDFRQVRRIVESVRLAKIACEAGVSHGKMRGIFVDHTGDEQTDGKCYLARASTVWVLCCSGFWCAGLDKFMCSVRYSTVLMIQPLGHHKLKLAIYSFCQTTRSQPAFTYPHNARHTE